MKNFFENITVDNFKVFKDSKSIRLAPINILIGKNNSGKSTLMELMKLIKVSLDQSSLNKLMFSKLDGFQSFDAFKTFGYNKDVIKLRIPFYLKWFDCHEIEGFDGNRFYQKDKPFFLSLEYKESENNTLDGILYKYEITDNDGDTIYKTERIEWDKNHKSYDKDMEYINEHNLILGKFFINYKKISQWVNEFYDMKDARLQLLRTDLIRDGIKVNENLVNENLPVDELFPTLESERDVRNIYAQQEFIKKYGSLNPGQKGHVITNEDADDFEEVEKYNGAHYEITSIDIAPRFSGRTEIKKESLLDKDMHKHFSITMWNEIMKSSLLFEYDNEDGSPISKKQIKLIKKIEEDVLKDHHDIAIRVHEFYERKYSLDVISDKVKARLFEAEGKIRIILYQNEITDEVAPKYTSYGIFFSNIIDSLSSIPNNLLKSDNINTSDVDTIKNDITNFLKPIYNNPLEDYQKDFVNKWLKAFTYTDDSGYEIKRAENELKICFSKTSIDSYGKGLQELIYLIFNIAKQKKDKESIMLVVEPEAHLHPNFQSLLADMFADATKEFNIKFIIESHSEYLLRKLQYLTISKELKAGFDASYFSELAKESKLIERKTFGDVIVNYFDNNLDANTTIINQIYIDEYGNLSDNLGEGFTDHTPKLMMDILKLKTK